MSAAFCSIDARSRSIDRGVKIGWRMRRSRLCCGWSMFSIICRKMARLSSVSEGMNVPPSCDEKRSWSRSTAETSSWEVTTQKPGLSTNWKIGLSPSIPATGGSACQAMPPCRRSSSNASCGGPGANVAGDVRSQSTRSDTSRAPAGGVSGVRGPGRVDVLIGR